MPLLFHSAMASARGGTERVEAGLGEEMGVREDRVWGEGKVTWRSEKWVYYSFPLLFYFLFLGPFFLWADLICVVSGPNFGRAQKLFLFSFMYIKLNGHEYVS